MANSRVKFPVRQVAAYALAAGFLVDNFGFAGAGTSALLRTNDFTRPAAAYTDMFGQVAHFSWLRMVDLATDVNDAVQYNYNR